MKRIHIVFNLLIVASLVLTACGSINPDMNTNGPAKISCPAGYDQLECTSTKGHFNVTDACEYQTDTPHLEKITYWSIRDGVSINGKKLVVNEKYQIDYAGGTVDAFTCVLDFISDGSFAYPSVNFEIIKEVE